MTQTSWLVFSKVSHLYFQKCCLFCCKFSFAGELCVQVWLLHRQPLLLRHHLPSGVSSFSKILLLFTCQQFCLTRWTRRPPWSRPPSSSPWSSITVTPTRRSTSAGMHNTSGTRNDWMLYLDTFQVLESSTGDESQPQRRHWGDQQLWHLRHPGVAVFGPNLTKVKLNLFNPKIDLNSIVNNLLQEGPKPGVETEGVILDYDRFNHQIHIS